jgi:hypothetical protein
MRLGSHWMTVPNKCQSIIVIWKDANTNHTHHCDVQCNELSWYDCNATLLGNVRILAVTMKLITIERFFPAGFHEISAPKSHVLYQSYVKSL